MGKRERYGQEDQLEDQHVVGEMTLWGNGNDMDKDCKGQRETETEILIVPKTIYLFNKPSFIFNYE